MAIHKILTAINALEYLSNIASDYSKYQQSQQQRTRRREVAAWERTNLLENMVSAYTEYTQITEQEQTKRREIEAWEKEVIAKINTQRDVLIEYLYRSFDERAANFHALFSVVDRAIESGNNEQIAFTLNSITELAKSNPFKELASLATVSKALDDPNHEWQF